MNLCAYFSRKRKVLSQYSCVRYQNVLEIFYVQILRKAFSLVALSVLCLEELGIFPVIQLSSTSSSYIVLILISE